MNLPVVLVSVRQRAKDRSGKPACVEAKWGWLVANSLVADSVSHSHAPKYL